MKSRKHIQHRTFYRPPPEGLVPDPIREALYGKQPEPPVDIVPPPVLPVISRPTKR